MSHYLRRRLGLMLLASTVTLAVPANAHDAKPNAPAPSPTTPLQVQAAAQESEAASKASSIQPRNVSKVISSLRRRSGPSGFKKFQFRSWQQNP